VDSSIAPLTSALSGVKEAIDDVRAARFVVVVDTAAEAGFGCVTIAAEQASTEAVNFLLREARGPLYLCLSNGRCEKLGLSLIGTSSFRSDAAFMVSLEARDGVTSGVSAEDRARTIRLAADSTVGPAAFVYPGHVPVLRARPSGVLERARQTEAAVDLARLRGSNRRLSTPRC
jgi:3,4-dihydroxy 2-butanone 4-phosphate synthase/GTP cyclohydrolase II